MSLSQSRRYISCRIRVNILLIQDRIQSNSTTRDTGHYFLQRTHGKSWTDPGGAVPGILGGCVSVVWTCRVAECGLSAANGCRSSSKLPRSITYVSYPGKPFVPSSVFCSSRECYSVVCVLRLLTHSRSEVFTARSTAMIQATSGRGAAAAAMRRARALTSLQIASVSSSFSPCSRTGIDGGSRDCIDSPVRGARTP